MKIHALCYCFYRLNNMKIKKASGSAIAETRMLSTIYCMCLPVNKVIMDLINYIESDPSPVYTIRQIRPF